MAMYDDDILEESIKMKVAFCKCNILPNAYCTRKIDDMEVCLGSKKGVYMRRSPGNFALTRAYLVSLD